jgi:hypothetical protein
LAHPPFDVRILRATRQIGLSLLVALLPLACAGPEGPTSETGGAEARPAQASLTELERLAPSQQGDRLCQPALGFSVAVPGENFERDLEAEAKLNPVGEAQDSIWWAWKSNSGWYQVLAVKGAAASPESFARFLEGKRETLRKGDGLTIQKDEAVTNAPPYSWVLELQTYNAQSLFTSCISPSSPTETSAVVCIRTLTNSPGELKEERNSVQFGAC